MTPFEFDGDHLELTQKAVVIVKQIGHLFLTSTLSLDQIASEVGLDNGDMVRLLWILADTSGLLNELGW